MDAFYRAVKWASVLDVLCSRVNEKLGNWEGRRPECRPGGRPTTSSGPIPTGPNADGLNADRSRSF